jgi:predicted TIM-barrel fold metal-dependent hydrolase
LRPSEYFLRQCWVSFEPDEKLIPYVIKEVGANKFFWASDFPHDDGFPGVVGRVKESISRLPEEDQNKVLGDNAIEVYNLN